MMSLSYPQAIVTATIIVTCAPLVFGIVYGFMKAILEVDIRWWRK